MSKSRPDGTGPDDRGRPGRRGRARPGYHDPTAGIGGAAPAQSALTLRLVLALFGVVVCTAAAVVFALVGAPLLLVGVVAALAVIAGIDAGVVLRRKRRGEPG